MKRDLKGKHFQNVEEVREKKKERAGKRNAKITYNFYL